MILLTAILLLLTPLFWWFLNLTKYKCLQHIPGPKPLPAIGNSLDIGSSPQELLKNHLKLYKTYGKIFKCYIGNELRIFIADPDLAEKLLTSNTHITKSNSYNLLKPWMGSGLLLSTGKKWKDRRKMIAPTFHFKILEQFIKIFNSASDILVAKLSNEVNKEKVDITTFLNLHTLDVICETAMGVKINAQENNYKDYVVSVKDRQDIFVTRAFSSWQKFDCLFQFSKNYSKSLSNIKTLHDLANSVIQKKREEKSSIKVENKINEDGIKRKTALLDMLLESENNNLLTNEGLREEINTFVLAGNDITATVTSFAILALAENPEIQEKVYQEIQEILGSENNIRMQHLQEMKYLNMVINEVLRLYPPGSVIGRKLETDYSLGDYTFPKGVTLNVFIYGIHHSEEYFPNPEIFDPDRFLPENQSKRHKFAFIPFSAGPRNCIGQKFAMYEMKVTIAKILKKFKILQVSDFKADLGMGIILKSHNGVKVRLEVRN